MPSIGEQGGHSNERSDAFYWDIKQLKPWLQALISSSEVLMGVFRLRGKKPRPRKS